MSNIKSISAYEVLASGGFPTIECRVETNDGHFGVASVSYGASAGSHEASVLTDGDLHRYGGKGVLGMCKSIEEIIAPKIIGLSVFAQQEIDKLLVDLDGTEQKSNLGGNTILAVSTALARAGANVSGLELFSYLQKTYELPHNKILPKPMVVTIEGGVHADNSTDLQEYLLTITTSESAKENVRVASEIYQVVKRLLKNKNFSVNVGNEGAFAPEGITSNSLPLEILHQAIIEAGYKPGKDAYISLDAAASEFYKNGMYTFSCEKRNLRPQELLAWYAEQVQKFPIYSLEDIFAEDAWEDWSSAMEELGGRVLIMGDDLTVTNIHRLRKAIESKAINSILIKLNQAGTVSETVATCKLAKEHNIAIIPSHRGGGESNDAFLVDLAVAVGGDFIKVGITRGERVAKYNRLMEIERLLQHKI